MALIKCPECGKEISDKAESCPHCGYPITENAEAENINILSKENLVIEGKRDAKKKVN